MVGIENNIIAILKLGQVSNKFAAAKKKTGQVSSKFAAV